MFTPLLPEVATGGLDQHNVVEPIRDIVHQDIEFIQSGVQSIFPDQKKITLENKKDIFYDALVLALGSETFFFNTPGAKEHSYILKSLDDAVVIRNRFIDIFEQASQESDLKRRRELLTFIIVGGGPTGVELTGEAAGLFFDTLDKQYKNINRKDISITLINAASSLISIFDERLQKYAQKSLSQVGVNILNNTLVTEIDENGLIIKNGERINAATVIWAAGVVAKKVQCHGSEFKLESGKICTYETLQSHDYENIFVVGDMAHVSTPDGRGYPMTAQVAKQQGLVVGKNIINFLEGKNLKNFVYEEKGLLASLGTFDAVAQVKGFTFTGIFAWFIWRTVYLFNFASHQKRAKILFDWTIGLFTGRDTTRF